MKADVHLNYLVDFTEIFKSFSASEIYERELAILNHQVPAMFHKPEAGERIVGRMSYPALVFCPQAQAPHGGFGYVFDMAKFDALKNAGNWSLIEKKQLLEIENFWMKNDTARLTRNSYPEEISKWLPSDNWTGEPGIAFPLYRMSGSHPDYAKMLNLGVKGLKALISEKEGPYGSSSPQGRFYRTLSGALDVFSNLCRFYASQLLELVDRPESEEYKSDTLHLACILREIALEPPSTFHAAVQMTHLLALISGSNNYGRMDDYLAPFLEADLKDGKITEELSLSILSSFWQKINARKIIWDGRVITGGLGRKNLPFADEMALLLMETSRRNPDVLPQLTLRCYDGMDERLCLKAFQLIGEGNTYPILYYDGVNVPSAARAFKISSEEAKDCIPFGCGEYVLNHRSFGTPSGVINLLKILEITLHRGTDPLGGSQSLLPGTEKLPLDSFEKLYEVYKLTLEKYIHILALQEKLEYDLAGRTAPFLFLSLGFDSCIERGLPLFSGGIDHLGGTLETYGNTNAADSFFAIRHLVYEEKSLSLEELVEALDNNFDGFSTLRRNLLSLPKYGNDHNAADQMMKRVHEDVCLITMAEAEKVGLDSYLVVNINNSANTILGRFTAASADGRLAGAPMANGNTPSPGMDQNGLTALLNSLAKMRTDIHAGASQNIKLSPGLLREYLPATRALIQTYFKKGGAQLMVTVVNRGDLERALEHPEEYPNLLVRVGGFSARFVELDRDIQLEILNRTLY